MQTNKFIRWILAACTVGLGVSPAAALTCAPPSLERSFDWASEAPETYGIFIGDIDIDEIAAENMVKDDVYGYEMMAEFTGKMILPSGLSEDLQKPILMQSICYTWECGDLSDVENTILFIQIADDGGLSYQSQPCGGHSFNGSEENIDYLVRRFNGLQ